MNDRKPTPVPEGYSEADVKAVTALAERLIDLVDGVPNHIAVSALLSVYLTAAESTGDELKAAQHLVHTGTRIIERHLQERLVAATRFKPHDASAITTPASTSVH